MVWVPESTALSFYLTRTSASVSQVFSTNRYSLRELPGQTLVGYFCPLRLNSTVGVGVCVCACCLCRRHKERAK